MGTKQVRLDGDVYAKIKDKKRDGESFSDAIDRLTDDWSLVEFSTGMTGEGREAYQGALEDIKEKTDENVGETLEQMDVEE